MFIFISPFIQFIHRSVQHRLTGFPVVRMFRTASAHYRKFITRNGMFVIVFLSCLVAFFIVLFIRQSVAATSTTSGKYPVRNTNRVRIHHNNRAVGRPPRRKKPNDRQELWPHRNKRSIPYTGMPGQITATIASGLGIGMDEYLVEVLIGTPPMRFSLILDTGSDLTWIWCHPCHDCYDQTQPYYDPTLSTSFHKISCRDPKCGLVEPPPDQSRLCRANDHSQNCLYYYFYGDSSNTTGEFAVETFTFNRGSPDWNPKPVMVQNLMFGCGHRNRVDFRGASGMLGMGRGPLSLSTQLQQYWNAFYYCFVDPTEDGNATSKLVFGPSDDLSIEQSMNFTSFITDKPNLDQTYYYLQIESVSVGGEVLNIPKKTWDVSPDGSGGTIIDSGTTLSYFLEPAYEIIKEAFRKKIGSYATVENERFDLCYEASPGEKLEMPGFGIVFSDGAEWNFGAENVFILLQPEDIVCLAMMRIDRFSIIGNHQQKNFRVLYDREGSRLGFSPMRCAEV